MELTNWPSLPLMRTEATMMTADVGSGQEDEKGLKWSSCRFGLTDFSFLSLALRVVPTVPATRSLASNNMSDMLNLNCWLLGDDPRRIFSVEIAKTKTVDGLKKAIKEDPSSKGDFNGIDAKYLDRGPISDNQPNLATKLNTGDTSL
jgi:hypothetical protein